MTKVHLIAVTRQDKIFMRDSTYFISVFAISVSLLSLLLPVALQVDSKPSRDNIGYYPACGIGGAPNGRRIVAIGDVHGNYEVMLQVLLKAGIINSDSNCEWSKNVTIATPVELIQVGDIVDRGPAAPQAWRCLRHLQETAPVGSSVVRLVGNHEIYWLEGNLRFRYVSLTLSYPNSHPYFAFFSSNTNSSISLQRASL